MNTHAFRAGGRPSRSFAARLSATTSRPLFGPPTQCATDDLNGNAVPLADAITPSLVPRDAIATGPYANLRAFSTVDRDES